VNFLNSTFPDTDRHFYLDTKLNSYHDGIEGISTNIDETVLYFQSQIESYEHVVLIGVSSGGYAAILFGSLLNHHSLRVVAFIPQTVRINSTGVNETYRDLLPWMNPKTHYYLYGDLSMASDPYHCISHCTRVAHLPHVYVCSLPKLNLREWRDSGKLKSLLVNISCTVWKPPKEWENYLERFLTQPLPPIPQNTTRYCVIVEPRCSPYLERVIRNFIAILAPQGWGFILFHGVHNSFMVRKLGIRQSLLHVENLTPMEYNDLLCSSSFWENLISQWNCHHCLIFQCDTLLLRGDLERFLQYDYVGAPWNFNFSRVGNGGLSLRKVSTMIEICRTCPRYIRNNSTKELCRLDNEDIYFAFYLERMHFRVPTVKIASEFSVETIYYNQPCGLHQPHFDQFPSHWRDELFVGISFNI
jgi:hypothetical protein